MGDHADDALFAGLDQSWGWRRPRVWSPPPKPSNQRVFSRFAGPIHGDFKTGQRLIHIPSGIAGEVLATRGNGQICWRPDTGLFKGGVWVDADKFRHEDF